jgi:hypothetical protein
MLREHLEWLSIFDGSSCLRSKTPVSKFRPGGELIESHSHSASFRHIPPDLSSCFPEVYGGARLAIRPFRDQRAASGYLVTERAEET